MTSEFPLSEKSTKGQTYAHTHTVDSCYGIFSSQNLKNQCEHSMLEFLLLYSNNAGATQGLFESKTG